MTTKLVNGKRVEMTQAEIDEFEASRTPTLEQAKADKCIEINNKRDNMQAKSLEYTFPDGKKGHIQRRNQKDERNIQGVAFAAMGLVLSNNTTDKIHFTDEENIKHKITGSEGIVFGIFVQKNYAQNQDNARKHKDNINLLETIKDIQSYDFLTGWV